MHMHVQICTYYAMETLNKVQYIHMIRSRPAQLQPAAAGLRSARLLGKCWEIPQAKLVTSSTKAW